VAVVEGNLGPERAAIGLAELGEEVDVSFELLRGEDIGVSTSAGSKLVVEEVESLQRRLHLFL
jgi:hypothetical protein